MSSKLGWRKLSQWNKNSWKKTSPQQPLGFRDTTSQPDSLTVNQKSVHTTWHIILLINCESEISSYLIILLTESKISSYHIRLVFQSKNAMWIPSPQVWSGGGGRAVVWDLVGGRHADYSLLHTLTLHLAVMWNLVGGRHTHYSLLHTLTLHLHKPFGAFFPLTAPTIACRMIQSVNRIKDT